MLSVNVALASIAFKCLMFCSIVATAIYGSSRIMSARDKYLLPWFLIPPDRLPSRSLQKPLPSVLRMAQNDAKGKEQETTRQDSATVLLLGATISCSEVKEKD